MVDGSCVCLKTKTAEGYPGKTCRKALGVFYATCQKKGLDYAKPMPKEKVREHVSAIFPFQILEKIVDTPLRIRGLAITADRALGCLEINLSFGLPYIRKKLWALNKCLGH